MMMLTRSGRGCSCAVPLMPLMLLMLLVPRMLVRSARPRSSAWVEDQRLPRGRSAQCAAAVAMPPLGRKAPKLSDYQVCKIKTASDQNTDVAMLLEVQEAIKKYSSLLKTVYGLVKGGLLASKVHGSLQIRRSCTRFDLLPLTVARKLVASFGAKDFDELALKRMEKEDMQVCRKLLYFSLSVEPDTPAHTKDIAEFTSFHVHRYRELGSRLSKEKLDLVLDDDFVPWGSQGLYRLQPLASADEASGHVYTEITHVDGRRVSVPYGWEVTPDWNMYNGWSEMTARLQGPDGTSLALHSFFASKAGSSVACKLKPIEPPLAEPQSPLPSQEQAVVATPQKRPMAPSAGTGQKVARVRVAEK